MNWDQYHLAFARTASLKSKDPSTQVGAIAVRGRDVLDTGFNGYPPGVPDVRLGERDYKLARTVHAEMNLICHAAKRGISLEGCKVFIWPFPPCSNCMKHLIAVGVTEIVTPPFEAPARWIEDFVLAGQLANESGVRLRVVCCNE